MSIVKEYLKKDTCNRDRLYVDVVCSVCTNIFSRQKRLLKPSMTCSIGCNNVLKGTSVQLKCAHCSKEFFRSLSKSVAPKFGLSFCNRECKEAGQGYIKEIQPSHYGTGTGEFSYREKAFNHYKAICAHCSYSNILALEVHHIDKNRRNNDLSNLQILCANCHTIEHKGL